MGADVRIRLAMAVAVVAALVLGGPVLSGFRLLFVLFAFFNMLVEPPGTAGVRASAVLASLLALLVPQLEVRVALVVLLCWPALYIFMWALARRDASPADAAADRSPEADRARLSVGAIVVGVAAVSILYR